MLILLQIVWVNRLSVLFYSNQNDNAEKFKIRRYYLPKGIIKNYNVIINGKNVTDQANDSGIKQPEKIRKLTTGQGEYYATGCFLDYKCTRNHYK